MSSSANYLPRLGRIIDSDKKTWRIVDEKNGIVKLENEYYIVDENSEEKRVDLNKCEILGNREIGKMARYICQNFAKDPISALKDWTSGEGWRAPEGVFPALVELCHKFIDDTTKLEKARMYFNDEYNGTCKTVI